MLLRPNNPASALIPASMDDLFLAGSSTSIWIQRIMITNRIYDWARSQPTNPAVIFNDVTLSYAAFANAIESARGFFGRQGLQLHQTAIVLSESLLDAWVFVMALRALGLNTVYVQSADRVDALRLSNVGCVVVPEAEARKFTGASLEAIKYNSGA